MSRGSRHLDSAKRETSEYPINTALQRGTSRTAVGKAV